MQDSSAPNKPDAALVKDIESLDGCSLIIGAGVTINMMDRNATPLEFQKATSWPGLLGAAFRLVKQQLNLVNFPDIDSNPSIEQADTALQERTDTLKNWGWSPQDARGIFLSAILNQLKVQNQHFRHCG